MIWRIRQLIPHTHWTVYGDQSGAQHFVIWRQWMGHCFDIIDTVTGPAIAQQPV